MLGGVCAVCGAAEDLEFDHIDPSTKEYRITDVISMRYEVRIRELGKCQLLCVDHHADKTEEDNASDIVPF